MNVDEYINRELSRQSSSINVFDFIEKNTGLKLDAPIETKSTESTTVQTGDTLPGTTSVPTTPVPEATTTTPSTPPQPNVTSTPTTTAVDNVTTTPISQVEPQQEDSILWETIKESPGVTWNSPEMRGVRNMYPEAARSFANTNKQLSNAFDGALEMIVDGANLVGLNIDKTKAFEEMTKTWEAKAEEYTKMMEDPTLIDDVVGELSLGAIIGIAKFAAGTAFAGVEGAAEGYKEGGLQGAIKGAAVGAAQRSIMGKILHASGVLKMFPRIATMAGIGAVESAAGGGDIPEIVKGGAVMGVFGAAGGPGKQGVKDTLKDAATQFKKAPKPVEAATTDVVPSSKAESPVVSLDELKKLQQKLEETKKFVPTAQQPQHGPVEGLPVPKRFKVTAKEPGESGPVIELPHDKPPEPKLTLSEQADPHLVVERRVNEKYKDILNLPESDIPNSIFHRIEQGTMTPEILDKYLSRVKDKNKAISGVESAIADRTGELIETHKYESAKDGYNLEGYIDSLLDVTRKHRLPTDKLPDKLPPAEVKPAERPETIPDNTRVESLAKVKTPEPVNINKNKAGEAVVSVPGAPKQTTPKEQKTYLLKEVNAALRNFDKDKRKISDGYKFEVPGDGEFWVQADKAKLVEFKKIVDKKFPATEAPSKDPGKKPSVPKETKGTGKRVTGVEYYNEFKPRKHPMVERKPENGEPMQWLVDGWFTNSSYLVKVDGKQKLRNSVQTDKEKSPDIDRILKAVSGADIKPAKIVGETVQRIAEPESYIDPQIHVTNEAGTEHLFFDHRYIDSILTQHPKAKPYIGKQMLVFKTGNDVVGVAMPLRGGVSERAKSSGAAIPELGEYALKRYQQITGSKPSSGKPSKVSFSGVPSGGPTATASLFSGKIELLPDKRHEIIKDLVNTLKVPIRVGKFRKRRGNMTISGFFNYPHKFIRIDRYGNFKTIAHEQGHNIQQALGWKLDHKFPVEVQKLAYPGAKDINHEGWAEYLRYWVTDKAKLKQYEASVPELKTFTKEFEERLAATPEIEKSLKRFQGFYKRYSELDPVSRLANMIVNGRDIKKPKSKNKVATFYQETVDQFFSLKKATQKFEATIGKKIEAHKNPYNLAWLTNGMAGKIEQAVENGTFRIHGDKLEFVGKPLKKILKPVIGNIDKQLKLDTYLIAKRAQHDPRIRKGLQDDFADKDFNAIVKGLEKEYEPIAKELYKYSETLMQYMVDAGRISSETAAAIAKKNLFYAPLYRFFDAEFNPELQMNGSGKGSSFESVKSPVKRMSDSGSGRDILSPSESILQNTIAMISAAERNRVGVAFIDMYRAVGAEWDAMKHDPKLGGTGNLLEKIPFKVRPVKANTAEILKALDDAIKPADNVKMDADGLEKAAVEFEKAVEFFSDIDPKMLPEELIVGWQAKKKAGANEVIFHKDGVPYLFETGDKNLLKTLRGLTPETVGPFLQLFKIPAATLRAGAVVYSDKFPMRNIFRDQAAAAIYSKYNYIPFYDAYKGIKSIIKNDEMNQYAKAIGGDHAMLTSMDRNFIADWVSQLEGRGVIKHAIKHPFDAYAKLGELLEVGTRQGEFINAVKKEGTSLAGLTKAGLERRDITLDFQRKGSNAFLKMWSMLTSFQGARIQGLDKMHREMLVGPWNTKAGLKRKAEVYAKAIALQTVPQFVIWAAHQGEDKASQLYQNLPTWRRMLCYNWVFELKNGEHFTLSLPGFHEMKIIFGALPEMAWDKMKGNNPIEMKEITKALLENLNPLDIPTAGKAPLENFFNYSLFRDTPVVERGKENGPAVLQYGVHTSETAKMAAKLMDRVPGLRKIASPDKIENLVNGYFGAAGDMSLYAGDELLKVFKFNDDVKPAETWHDAPFVRAFIVRHPSRNTRNIERFYGKLDKLRDEHARMEAKHPGIKRRPVLKAFERRARTLSVFRHGLDIIAENKNMTPREKRAQIDQMYIQMDNAAEAALKMGLEN